MIKLQDSNLPGSRIYLFLIVLVAAFLQYQRGFEQLAVWSIGWLGVFCLFLISSSSLILPGKIKGRSFFGVWWLGILLLMAAQAIAFFTPPAEILD